MANKKLTKALATALASEFCVNGFKKGAALRAVGYSKAYSKTTDAGKLFDHPTVIEAMEAIAKRNADAVDVTIEEIVRGFKSIAFPPEGVHVNNADKNTALASLAKYKNMFTDRIVFGEDEEAKKLTEHEEKYAKHMAHMCLLHPPEEFGLGDKLALKVNKTTGAFVSVYDKENPEPFTDDEILQG